MTAVAEYEMLCGLAQQPLSSNEPFLFPFLMINLGFCKTLHSSHVFSRGTPAVCEYPYGYLDRIHSLMAQPMGNSEARIFANRGGAWPRPTNRDTERPVSQGP